MQKLVIPAPRNRRAEGIPELGVPVSLHAPLEANQNLLVHASAIEPRL